MKTTRRWVPGLALALASMVPTGGFASPRWVQATPFGGALGRVVRAPSAPEIVYATSRDFGAFFRSEDDGTTWNRVGTSRIESLDLRVAPDDPATLYAVYGDRSLWRTRDGGTSWAQIGTDLIGIFSIATEAQNPDRLLVGTGAGLFRSEDFGDHWVEVAFADKTVIAIAADPQDDRILLANLDQEPGSDFPTVWRSTDHGLTWTITPLGELSREFGEILPHFVFDASRNGTVHYFSNHLFEEFAGPVFRSTDGGATWTETSTTRVQDLVSTADGVLFAVTPSGTVLSSTDRGDTWEPTGTVGTPRDYISHLAASPAAPGTVLATGGRGLWKSVDGGVRWRNRSRGIPVPDVLSLGVAPTGKKEVVTVAGGRFFRSSDRGASWQWVGSPSSPPFAITFDPLRSERIYGPAYDGQADGLFRSDDRGDTWSRLPFPYDCDDRGPLCDVGFGAFALDPSQPETLYVSGGFFYFHEGQGKFFLRSRDGGSTWKSLPLLKNLIGLFVDPRRPTVLYGLTPRRLYKSEDWAKTWRIVGRGLPPFSKRTLAIDPQDPRRLYAGTARGVFSSLDGGETFQALNAGIERQRIGKILLDPTHSDRLYAAGTGTGVFRWNPAARRWTPLNDGLPISQFYEALALDPRDPKTLYAGTLGSGVLRLDLEGF